MSKLTLQINNLEALERLIGGDTHVEMDIRQSVVEAFTKKHLKALATTQSLNTLLVALKTEINNELIKTVKQGYSSTIMLTNEAKSAIGAEIDEIINTQLHAYILEVMGNKKIKERLSELIERQANYINTELSSSVIEKRLNAMVDAKIKEKLGLK